MTFRSDRAQAIIRQIEEHPETWDQCAYRSYSCGAAFCFAGWAQVCAGNVATTSVQCRRDAKRWLALSNRQADYAFHHERTLDELREFAKTGRVPA